MTLRLYGKKGGNFVYTMLHLAKDHCEVKVVVDQVGALTCYHDLARVLTRLIELLATGIFHVANSQLDCSRFAVVPNRSRRLIEM